MAYSEQDGTYRHAGKNIGEMAHLYPWSKNSATRLEVCFIYFLLSFRQQDWVFAGIGKNLDPSLRSGRQLIA
jgi:hypothetical protein